MNELTEFGLAVKHRLVDLRQPQSWLVEQVREKTGLFFDNSYLYKILTGTEKGSKFIPVIRETLGMKDETANAG